MKSHDRTTIIDAPDYDRILVDPDPMRPSDGQRIPTIPSIAAHRRAADPERVSPAAARLVQTAVDELRERLGDTRINATPPLEAALLDHGRAQIAVFLTFNVADLNRQAADVELVAPTVIEDVALADAERSVLAAMRDWHDALRSRSLAGQRHDHEAWMAADRMADGALERAMEAEGRRQEIEERGTATSIPPAGR